MPPACDYVRYRIVDLDRVFSGLFNAIEVIGLAVIAYSGWRVKQLATRNNEIIIEAKEIAVETKDLTVDTNTRAVNTEQGMEEIRHQTNAMKDQLVEATAARFQLEGEAAGRIQERGTIDQQEIDRAERKAERAEDQDERQRMRDSWQAHDRDQGRRREGEDRERRGLPDAGAHE